MQFIFIIPLFSGHLYKQEPLKELTEQFVLQPSQSRCARFCVVVLAVDQIAPLASRKQLREEVAWELEH